MTLCIYCFDYDLVYLLIGVLYDYYDISIRLYISYVTQKRVIQIVEINIKECK